MKEFNSFIEQMKTLGVKRYLKVSVLNLDDFPCLPGRLSISFLTSLS